MARKLIDLTGQKFNRLTVLKTYTKRVVHKHKNFVSFSDCICDCGKEVTVESQALKKKSDGTTSCGCKNMDHIAKLTYKHGKSDHYLFKIWGSMKSRCLNTNQPGFKNYGGRLTDPVTIYSEWIDSFQAFYNYVVLTIGERPTPLYSIDRIRTSEGYYPGNLKWSTDKEQTRNKYKMVYLTYKGVKLLLVEWAERIGFADTTLRNRLKEGWPDEKAITTPTRNLLKYPSIKPNLDWLLCEVDPGI